MTQQIINVGEVANDGTGESLRTAFEAVNNNFSQIWSSGPVNSNVVIANNVISTTPVNTPLVLAPGGVGNIQSNAHIMPGTTGVYDLGSPVARWDSIYGDYLYGNGFFLTGIQVANVGSLVNGNSNVVIQGPNGVVTVSVNATPNVAVFTSTGLNVAGTITASGNITAPYFIGDGSLLTNIVATAGSSIDNGNSNVRIGADAANVAISVSGVGNIAVFTPTGLQVANTITATNVVTSGNITAARFIGNGATLSSINASNVVGFVPLADYANEAAVAGIAYVATAALQANIANTVALNAQPNITSLGNLTNLVVVGNTVASNVNAQLISVSGNINSGNARLGNTAQANFFVGNGSLLTGIQATTGTRIENGTTNVNIALANGNVTVSVAGVSNVATVTPTGLTVTGTLQSTNYTGNGAGLNNITGANVTGFVANANYSNTAGTAGLAYLANVVINNAQPNITSVGILNSLSATGNIRTNNYFIGNGRFLTGIAISGGTKIQNGNTAVSIDAPGGNVSIDVGGVANTVVFAANVTEFTTNIVVQGNTSTGNLITTGEVSAVGDITGANVLTAGQVSATGNVTGDYILGNGAFLTGVITSVSNIVSGNSNIDIASPGANITVGVGGNANVATFTPDGLDVQGNVTAGYFIGNVIGNISGNLSVPGANTQVLYNNDGQAGASAGFTFNQTSNVLSVTGNVDASAFNGSGVGLTYTQADRGSDPNNWNALTQMGTYTVNRVNWGGVTGPPLDSQVYVGLLTVSAGNTVPGVNAVQQVFAPGTVDPTNIKVQWIRNYWSGSWTPWVKMVNDVQQIDGGSF